MHQQSIEIYLRAYGNKHRYGDGMTVKAAGRRREDNNERAMSGTPLMTISSRGWMFDTAPPHHHPPTAHPPPPFATATINTYNRPICDLKASITLPSLNR